MKLKRTMLSLSVLAAASQLYAANLDVVRVIDENQVGQATTCLIMNQAMASSPDQKDINSFVNIENRNTGKAAAVNVMLNDRSVCLTGLEFGTKYVATLKKGLRSAEGGVLNANKDVEFTTIDRGQTVSFIGGHVLATSSKEKKIGVESINFDKFRINLFKIEDETSMHNYINMLGTNNVRLELMLKENDSQIRSIQEQMVVGMAYMVENRDSNTGSQ